MSERLAYAKAILVWHFEDAPRRFQQLVTRPGVWVVVVPKGVEPPAWARKGSSEEWGQVERRELTDGDVCLIALRPDVQVSLALPTPTEAPNDAAELQAG